MDWLTFKFCVLIWVLCVSTSKSQSQLLINSTISLSNQLRSVCEDGQSIVPPDECNACICFAGQKYCTNNPCPEQACVNGVDVPQPDACNNCICRRGKVACSNLICIPAPHCAEKQLYPAQNKCNACRCMNGFITCTANPCANEPLVSTIPTTTTKNRKRMKCTEGESLPGPGQECIECNCQNGRKSCKIVCNPTVESRFGEVVTLQMSEPECIRGQHIPRPDGCNNCICFEGQIHCTHLPCRMDIRIGPQCTDNQPVIRPDECNECYCFEGRLECSDLVCIRGSTCVQGQVIPKPDSCNACKCIEGHILCTNYQCPTLNSRNALRPGRSSTELRTRDECQEGDIISPPPPPNDCNTCYCIDNRILCTMNSCEGSDPEIKGRIKEPNEHTDLEIFDKQISVEPFINMLSIKNEKLPTKLIHTHAYNGFHQEIKVHANHLPKDATKLLKVLATSLDNAALASISKKILTSSHSVSNIHDSKIPLDNQVVPTKFLGEGDLLTTQSNKLITSGSQSNETILVIPNTEPFDYTNSQSVLPLISKHETIWKSVSSPGSLVFNNNQQINPHSSQEEKLNVYNYDNPPSMFTSIVQNNMIRDPSKFSRPGLPHRVPTIPTQNIVEIPNTNTQSIYLESNPKSININDSKISYAPFSQENNQFKLIPSGLENNQFKPIPSGFVVKRGKFPDRPPYQLIKPGHNQVFNYTSSRPIFRPGKFIITPNNNGGQQKPPQSQFIPLSKYYPNHVKPQQIQFKPNQNHLPTLNNKGIQHSPLFPNNPNPPIVAANQYKQPQFGLQPGQESFSPLNNKGNQTDQQFKTFHPNFQINPPLINLPTQKKRISSKTNEGSKEIPPHSMVPDSTAHYTNILNPPQIGVDPEHTQPKSSHSLFVSNPSIFYRNEYEVPKIVDVINPDKEQLIPHSKISYMHTEQYNPPHNFSEPGLDTLIPKVRNKTKKYNTSHSHYENYTTITYVSEYDPTHPANSLKQYPNQYQNAPLINLYEYYLPDQESQDLDLTMSKVNYYLNLHNKYNQHDSWNIKNHQFDTYPHSPSDGNNTDPHSSSQSQFILSQDNSKKGGLNNPKSAEDPLSLSNSAEDPTHPKTNKHLPPLSQTGPPQNQYTPGMFDDRGSADGFHYPSDSAENSLHPKDKLNKLLHIQFGPTQNQQLPGVFDERGSADGFHYPSNSAEMYPSNSAGNPTHQKNLTHPEQNKKKQSHSQVGPNHNKPTPGMFADLGSPDSFQYSSNLAKNHLHPKENLQYPTHSQFGPPQTEHLSWVLENRGFSGGFQYPSNSVGNPTHVKDNLQKPPQSQLLPSSNQQTPGVFDDRGSPDGFQYPSNLAENPTHPTQHKQIQPNSPFGPAQNQNLPGMFDERGSADGFQYPSNSFENPTHPNLHKFPQSQFLPSPNQHTPGIFDDRGSANGFRYPSNFVEDSKGKPPHSPLGPIQNQHLPGMFDERGSADGFQYPSYSAENSLQPKDNEHNPPYPQLGSNHNQHKPALFDEHGSADSFQFPSNFVKNPTHPKDNVHKFPQSKFPHSPNQHTTGVFDDRGSADVFQYSSNSAENPTHPKQYKQIQSKSSFGPAQNHHLPETFNERGSADGYQYPFNSFENPTHPKDNLHKLPHSQFLPSPNQHPSGVFDDRGSADGSHYPSISTHPKDKPPHSQLGPTQNQHLPGMFDERGSVDGFQYPSHSAENPLQPKDNQHNPPNSQFGPNENQHTQGVFDDRGPADGFHYPSNSTENPTHPKNNPNTIPHSEFKQPQNQPKTSSLDDGYNNNNLLGPWMHLDHDQYKPSSFGNLLNGVHNIPWSFPGDHHKDSDTVTFASEPRFTPDYDQYKPFSFDNLINGIHQIPWSVSNQENNGLGSDAEITTPRSGVKFKQDQYGPLMVNNPSISNQNENTDLPDVHDNQIQIEQDVSTPSTELTDSDNTQYDLLSKLKPHSDPDSLLLTDNVKIPDYYDQLYPLFKTVKNPNDPPIDDSLFSVGSMDRLDLLPFLFPGIAKILTYKPSHDKDDVSPDENHEVQMINPLSKLEFKLKQLPENNNRILNWLKSKFYKLLPTKDNATVTKNNIDMTKIFNLLFKLTPHKLKHTTALQNIPFSGFDPEIVENITNDFKEETLNTTSTPRTNSTHTFENRIMSIPTIPEESPPQAPQLKYPDIHLILHQPNGEDNEDLYVETNGEFNPATDIDYKELSASMLPKILNRGFRHRPKDQKEECGDGTQWISNCHGCSCYFGQAMCFRLPDCELRPWGEPMTCKPYSHFKMGCYTCECNGDGVAECDATDCNTKPSRKDRVSGSTESSLPIFNEFFDSKKTNEILQYYNFYKKLPKDCSKQDLQTQYPTCERGTSWISSCHKCECNERGKHKCIKIDDCELDIDSYGKPGRCKPNSKFYPKTNSMPCVECSCNDEGISYCPSADYRKH